MPDGLYDFLTEDIAVSFRYFNLQNFGPNQVVFREFYWREEVLS
jgi:hypothetical protein